MNDMVGHHSTAIEVDDSHSTNEVVHPHEATIEVDNNHNYFQYQLNVYFGTYQEN
jgi:hypothetical protein